MILNRNTLFTGVAASLALCGAASGHVAIQPESAVAGSYQVLRFAVGHGCGPAATTALRIDIPAGVSTARPQPKPGWTVESVPRADGGAPAAIVWRGGPLPTDQFDEFLMLVRTPSGATSLTFPTIQTCGASEMRWDQPIPATGPRPPRPAAVLRLTPPTASPSQTSPEHRH